VTLSRVHGSTTSGLFSDVRPLEGSEIDLKLLEKDNQKQHGTKIRRPSSVGVARSQRECRESSDDPLRGTSTSSLCGGGLFSDDKPIESSESSVHRAWERRPQSAQRRDSRGHSSQVEPWRHACAGAGLFRSVTLSRVHGSTTSGLFSDVRPLEGSEIDLKLLEKDKQKQHGTKIRQRANRPSGTGDTRTINGDRVCPARPVTCTRRNSTSGLFSDVRLLEATESEARLRDKCVYDG